MLLDFDRFFAALYFLPTIYNGGYTSDKRLTKFDRQMGEKKTDCVQDVSKYYSEVI